MVYDPVCVHLSCENLLERQPWTSTSSPRIQLPSPWLLSAPLPPPKRKWQRPTPVNLTLMTKSPQRRNLWLCATSGRLVSLKIQEFSFRPRPLWRMSQQIAHALVFETSNVLSLWASSKLDPTWSTILKLKFSVGNEHTVWVSHKSWQKDKEWWMIKIHILYYHTLSIQS